MGQTLSPRAYGANSNMLPTWPTKCLAIDTGVTGPVAIPGSKLVRLVVTSTDSLARSCGWNTSGSPRSLGPPRMCALPRGAFVDLSDQEPSTHQKVGGLPDSMGTDPEGLESYQSFPRWRTPVASRTWRVS